MRRHIHTLPATNNTISPARFLTAFLQKCLLIGYSWVQLEEDERRSASPPVLRLPNRRTDVALLAFFILPVSDLVDPASPLQRRRSRCSLAAGGSLPRR